MGDMNTTTIPAFERDPNTFTDDYRAFAAMAERLGATVEYRSYGIRFQVLDNELLDLLHRVAAVMGPESAVWGLNRFILFDPN